MTMGRPSFGLLHEAVSYHAGLRPDASAIQVGDELVTYGELADSMHAAAAALQSCGVVRGDRVVLLADNGIPACKAIHGILRADAAFVALNPAYPPQRIANIIEQAAPAAAVITADQAPTLAKALPLLGDLVLPALLVPDMGGDQARALFGSRIGRVLGQDDLAAMGPPAPSRSEPQDLAYILFTSGTTGVPKGVMISHGAVCATINWGVDHFQLTPDDRLSNHFRLSFDASVFDIFCAMFAGATVLPLTRGGDAAFPGDFIRRQKVTVWFSVPSVIDLMVQSRQLAAGAFTHLRAALFGGEPLTPAMVSAWMRHQPHVPIYNLYGPTEAAIACTAHQVGVDAPFDEGKPVPIGRETAGATIAVFKTDKDELAPAGEVGRLMIYGPQLADGYWRRPDLTAGAFRRDLGALTGAPSVYVSGDLGWRDDGGRIHYSGREDSQIKMMGFRIELGEIEVVVNAIPGVWESVVAYSESTGPEIIAIVTMGDDAVFDASAIIEHCARTLPGYMVPKRVICARTLPRNLNGKIDRRAALAQVMADAP